MNSVQKTARLFSLLAQVAFRNPGKLRHVLGTAAAAAEEVANPDLDLSRFRDVHVNDLLPEAGLQERATLALFHNSHASVSVLEFICLVLLMTKARERNVLEFGTYNGLSI